MATSSTKKTRQKPAPRGITWEGAERPPAKRWWWFLGFGYVSLVGVLVIAVLMMFVIRRIVTSPLGSAIRGTRENEVRMAVLGYNVWRYRLMALVLSGTLTGVAGALFAFQAGLIAPTNLGVAASGLLVLMVIIGGSGTRYGAFIGGIIVTLLTYYASQWNEQRAPLIVGVIFVVTALLNRYRSRVSEAFRGMRHREVSDVAA